MKTIKTALIIAVIAICSALTAQAQFKIGPRLGVNVNSLHFDKSTFDSDNRAGFTGGLMVEFTVPVIGIGLDASVMYVRRDAEWMENNASATSHRDYIAIPINLKYKFNLPAVNHIVRPFLTTGPEFAFLTSRTGINQFIKNKKSDFSWNFGIGVELISHLQVAASYGLGINKAVEALNLGNTSNEISAKNRYWTITAAWLF